MNEGVAQAGQSRSDLTAIRCSSAKRRGRVEALLASFGGKTEMTVQTNSEPVRVRGACGAACTPDYGGAPPMLENPRTLKPLRVACEESTTA